MRPDFDFGDDEQQTTVDCQFLELLLNSEVKSLSFSQLPRTNLKSKKRVTSTWMVMTQKCPNLQNLVCDLKLYYDNSSKLIIFYFFSLHFVNLQALECPYMKCDNQRLRILAASLPQLK